MNLFQSCRAALVLGRVVEERRNGLILAAAMLDHEETPTPTLPLSGGGSAPSARREARGVNEGIVETVRQGHGGTGTLFIGGRERWVWL
jgi:hypothetical protein